LLEFDNAQQYLNRLMTASRHGEIKNILS